MSVSLHGSSKSVYLCVRWMKETGDEEKNPIPWDMMCCALHMQTTYMGNAMFLLMLDRGAGPGTWRSKQ